MAEYFAVTTVMGCVHASEWPNIRFYYNPLTSRLEPIGYDGFCVPALITRNLEEYLPDCFNDEAGCVEKDATFWQLIFRDRLFFEKYIQELEKVSI